VAATCEEKFKSRRTRDGRRHERLYIITNADDEDEALSALAAEAPSTVGELVRQPLEVEPGEANDLWIGRARYVPEDDQDDEPKEAGDYEQSFEFGTRQEHITQSLYTCESGYNSDLTSAASDYGGAINVTQDDVKGVDIDFGYQVEEALVIVAESELPGSAGDFDGADLLPGEGGSMDAYKQICSEIIGRVNDAEWMGYAFGEVKMLSITGRKRAAGDWELRFRWAVAKNVEEVVIGQSPSNPGGRITLEAGATGVAKNGWDYLWVCYADDVDTDAGRYVQTPLEAYVEQVYEYVDFSRLKLEEWKAAAEAAEGE